MRKKLIYISPECFSDVDFPIIKELNKAFDLTWVVIFYDPKVSSAPKAGPSEIDSYAKKYNIDVKILIRKGRLKNPRNFLFDLKMIKMIKNKNPKIIYIESFVDIYFVFLSSLLLAKSKTIIGIHDVISHLNQLNKLEILSNNLQKLLFKKFHLFSQSQANVFISKYKNKDTFVIPLALKQIEGKKNLRNNQDKNKKTIFLFWGNIRYSKGLEYLINASEYLYRKGQRNFQTVIVGACENWDYYQKFIVHNKIFSLNLHRIPNDDIPELLCSAHFLVLPYRDVTQSGPLLFSYNYNLPVIASDLDGFKEYVIDKKTGFLFKRNDYLSLAKVMNEAIIMNKSTYQDIKNELDNYVNLNCSTNKIINQYISNFNSI